MWSVISTWPFSLQASQKAAEILSDGGSARDAAEQGIWRVESDPEVDSVGLGGYLSSNGILELDAAMMDGGTLRSGAVACLQGYEHPISVARAVLETTPHALLAGEGAAAFARKAGFKAVPQEALITDQARESWEKQQVEGHDTIGLVAMDRSGLIVAATSTSGTSMKLFGRVGDSPLIGGGFYAENGVGGCTATGIGEEIMKTCMSFRIVELMRSGMPPQAAAEQVVRSAHESILRRSGKVGNMAVVCMNAEGAFGAACNHREFWYSCAREGLEPAVYEVTPAVE